MLSKSSVYAMRAIIYIGHNSTPLKKIGIKEMAEDLEVPLHYLSKVMQRLTKLRIVQSIKGPNGGFYMEERSKSVNLLTVVEAIDGLFMFSTCGLGLKECSDSHPCPIHDDYKKIRNSLYLMLKNKKVSDLSTKLKEGDTFIRNLSKY